MNRRVLLPSSWSFDEYDKIENSGHEAISVGRFGYEYLKRWYNIDVCIPSSKNFKLFTLQCKLIKLANKYDLIYCAQDLHLTFFFLAKKLKLVKTPIVYISNFTFNTSLVDSRIKRIFLKIERYLVFSACEQVLFVSKQLMEVAMQDYKIPEKHQKYVNWGADVEYFKKANHLEENGYYFSAGGARRDYETLIKAFSHLKEKLIISCPKDIAQKYEGKYTNISFFVMTVAGDDRYDILRDLYVNSKCVLIPIGEINHVPNGATVMVEAIAAGKPIIATKCPANFLDVEKEKLGLTVGMKNVNEWISAIRKMEDKELYEKFLKNVSKCQKEYNYFDFSLSVKEYFEKNMR